MSVDGQGNAVEMAECCRNIAENLNRLSRAHERYRRQTDGREIAHSEREREFTFAMCYQIVSQVVSVAFVLVPADRLSNKTVVYETVPLITLSCTVTCCSKDLNISSYAMAVCPSVCLSQAGRVPSKRLSLLSRIQRRIIAQRLASCRYMNAALSVEGLVQLDCTKRNSAVYQHDS